MEAETAATVAAALALREALVRVRNATAGRVAELWRAVVDLEDITRSAAVFGAAATGMVEAGQRVAVALADLWAGRVFGRGPRGIDPARFVGASAQTPLPAVLASSGAYTWRALLRGADEPTALASGLYRATRVTTTEVTRAGLEAVADIALQEGSPGWRRRTSPGACPVCRGLADGSLQPWDEAVAAHPFCSCTPIPELAR